MARPGPMSRSEVPSDRSPAAAATDRRPGPEIRHSARDEINVEEEKPHSIVRAARALNSAARVPSSHGGSHWFESSSAHST